MTRSQRIVIALVILLAVALVIFLFSSGGDSPESTSTPAAAVQPTSTRASETPRPTLPPIDTSQQGVTGLFVEPDDGRGPILEELKDARESVTLQIYLLTDPEIIQALKDADARGVDVRVLLEENPFGGAGGQPETFRDLENAGIEIRWSNPTFTFSHIKTFVVDNSVAIIMNMNLTRSAFRSNREFGVVTTDQSAVRTAAEIFESDWSRSEEPEPGPLVVSPSNSREQLLGLIDGSQESLDIYAEVMRDRDVVSSILDARQRGVEVRLVMSDDADDNGDDERAELAVAGVQVRIENSPYIHAKIVLADRQRAFVGSENFTATSLDQNRELGIIVTEPTAIARIQAVFDEDFNNGAEEL
jgi:phosphatidylserine/phosphatidylglycerophosphate/cardiolipin synthase-like enzyme